MKNILAIGILAFHGDVIEHAKTLKQALNKLQRKGKIIAVRNKKDLQELDGLIIPGGESSIIATLSQRAGMWEDLRKVKNIFGTCAGAILLAKALHHDAPGQRSLELIDMIVDRNAYGRQTESFEQDIKSDSFGEIHAVFIRAPRIISVGKAVAPLIKRGADIIACQQTSERGYYLATCFHPELTTSKIHEHFIKNLVS